jgi:hypothetical protein
VTSQDPTNPDPTFVASEADRSLAVRRFLAAAMRILRTPVPTDPTGQGDLSIWVLALHGLEKDDKRPDHYKGQPYDESILFRIGEWMANNFGPYTNPTIVERIKANSEEITAVAIHQIKESGGDIANNLDAILPEKSAQLFSVWGFPAEFHLPFEISANSVRQMLRAFRALIVCMAINRSHLLALIARAFKGDRQAVLDLVKVDRLFLHDACTKSVVKNAEMLNDQNFLDQIVRAQKYAFRPTSRHIHHLYFQLLFIVENCGLPLPTLGELSRIIDRQGREYESLASFERDFQRQRDLFKQLLRDVHTELNME